MTQFWKSLSPVVEPISHDALENQAVDETHPTWIEFDAEALRHNLSIVRKSLTPGTQIIASVKANAYGHGIIPVSQVLEREGVEMLATGSFSDAQEIRRVGVKTPILMLAGTLPGGMKNLIQEGFIPTVYDLIGARSAAAAAKAIKDDYQHPIFIKVDCGMGRLGISLPNTLRFLEEIKNMPNLWVQGLYTHLSFKDDISMKFTRERLSLFYEMLKNVKQKGHVIPITQALASSALIMGLDDKCTAICPGHVLYGLSSITEPPASMNEFLPVLTSVKSRVIHVADHRDGPSPGSGGYHRNRTLSRTGFVPFGLHDGNASIKEEKRPVVLFKGKRRRVLGVSLEHLVFEVEDGTDLEIGDETTLIGGEGPEKIELVEFAAWQQSSPLEALMLLSNRLPITFKKKI